MKNKTIRLIYPQWQGAKAALDTLKIANPDKVVTLGGECSVSVPVSLLVKKNLWL